MLWFLVNMFWFSGNVSVQATGSSSLSVAGVEGGLPAEYVNSALFKESIAESVKKPAVKSEQEFEDELQLALAISQSEAEAQESTKRNKSAGKSGSFSSQNQNTQVGYLSLGLITQSTFNSCSLIFGSMLNKNTA